jgi:hypothetical protein
MVAMIAPFDLFRVATPDGPSSIRILAVDDFED